MRGFSIIEVTGGKFEVVASGLSWVDAMNQSMALAWQVGGTFREVADGTSAAEYRAERNRLAPCPGQAAWAYL